jgi:hypothetical protein
MNPLERTIYLIFSFCTAMIGYTIHRSIFWSIMDFIFTPLTWIKWILFHEVSLSIIKSTFTFLFN